jgi:hypothetical protein
MLPSAGPGEHEGAEDAAASGDGGQEEGSSPDGGDAGAVTEQVRFSRGADEGARAPGQRDDRLGNGARRECVHAAEAALVSGEKGDFAPFPLMMRIAGFCSRSSTMRLR